jgi:hypothetical protein
MTGQKITDCFGFMRAQVVANDVNDMLWSLAGDQIFRKNAPNLLLINGSIECPGAS